jgi:uncharacterized membrane protein YczE
MNTQKYQKIVDKHKPKENKIANLITAFIVGGFLGMLANFIMNLYTYIFSSLRLSTIK